MFQLDKDNAIAVTKAALILHNLMRTRFPNIQNLELEEANGTPPGSWRPATLLQDIQLEGRRFRITREGEEQRAYLRAYYCSEAGAVPWQEAAIAAGFV